MPDDPTSTSLDSSYELSVYSVVLASLESQGLFNPSVTITSVPPPGTPITSGTIPISTTGGSVTVVKTITTVYAVTSSSTSIVAEGGIQVAGIEFTRISGEDIYPSTYFALQYIPTNPSITDVCSLDYLDATATALSGTAFTSIPSSATFTGTVSGAPNSLGLSGCTYSNLDANAPPKTYTDIQGSVTNNSDGGTLICSSTTHHGLSGTDECSSILGGGENFMPAVRYFDSDPSLNDDLDIRSHNGSGKPVAVSSPW
ncbi:hypothetical protein PRZ48_004217 [Zasmidium cellare]|uniref:Uncharacterized protein n=1 Tax=Zasmidium cellare TaxID=395010 RepID=A0ABR0EX86_ZASCE|nr:hypothetical protein PRZ48_004217 [Zasmidium cellare]